MLLLHTPSVHSTRPAESFWPTGWRSPAGPGRQFHATLLLSPDPSLLNQNPPQKPPKSPPPLPNSSNACLPQWRASVLRAAAPPTRTPTNPSRCALVRPPFAFAFPGAKNNLKVGFDRVVFPLSVTGDSAARGLGVQPQLQPQGEPPRRHLMG